MRPLLVLAAAAAITEATTRGGIHRLPITRRSVEIDLGVSLGLNFHAHLSQAYFIHSGIQLFK